MSVVKKCTKNKNLYVRKTKQNRLMLLSKKSTFIKNKELLNFD